MATHEKHGETDAIYFVTFTCYKWLHLIEKANAYDHIYLLLDRLKEKGLFTTGFVIMPNHIHLMVFLKSGSPILNVLIGNFKRLLAYYLVRQLKKAEQSQLLKQLQNGVQENEKENGKKHQIWRLSFDAKLLESDKAISTVLDYMHGNPVEGKWKLVEDPSDYPHSSCSQYERGVVQRYKVFHIGDIDKLRADLFGW